MTITSILKELEGLSREDMIAKLQATRHELQSEQLKKIVPNNDLNRQILTINRILGAIEMGVRGSLTKSELQELRPVIQYFVENGEFSQSKFSSLYQGG
ncbi:hypothetical protein QUA46_08585 [Microcoleus sp. MON2_D6]|uniref:hypothetical protein n=1 Tax=unclassified Microcoleus TaxID=2642155 RepID=UPI002FCF6060